MIFIGTMGVMRLSVIQNLNTVRMYTRLGKGFKSNHALLRENTRNTISNCSSRLSLFESGSERRSINKSRQLSRQQSRVKEGESPFETIERLVGNIEQVLQQYPDLPFILRGELNSIIKAAKSIKGNNHSHLHTRQDKENNPSLYNHNISKRDASQDKLLLIDRLKTQSDIQVLMQKLIKSKQKRVKLADENFGLKSKLEESVHREGKLRKVVDNQNELIQSCVKEIDRLKEKTVETEWDEDLLSMLTLQAQQLQKAFKNSKLKRRIQ